MKQGPGAPDAATQISGLIFAVLLLDDEDRIVEANPAAEELLGRSAIRLLQARLLDVIDIDNDRLRQ